MALPQASVPLLPRWGVPPALHPSAPCLQTEQYPPPEVAAALVRQCLAIEGVRQREGRMATPRSIALSVDDQDARGPSLAFIDDHEFCHLHPPPNASLYLTLPEEVTDRIVALGWGQRHPALVAGLITAAVVVVYAPRDLKEVESVMCIVRLSLAFARGELA